MGLRSLLARRSKQVACLMPLAVAVLIACVAQGDAHMPTITVSPETPTDADSLEVAVGGWFFDSCWSFQGVQCGSPEDGEIAVDVLTHDDWLPGHLCLQVLMPYCCSCSYSPLPAGHYIVTVVEHHDSMLDPNPDTATLEFEVVPQSAVRELSWSGIRALYR